MFASIPSAVIVGAQGVPVSVEVHVAKGLPGFHVVGLPDESIRESRDRVRAAVMSSGGSWPDIKITVNLAPSRQRKSGSALDLAIAVGVLAASDQIPVDAIRGLAFLGEVGLDGGNGGAEDKGPRRNDVCHGLLDGGAVVARLGGHVDERDDICGGVDTKTGAARQDGKKGSREGRPRGGPPSDASGPPRGGGGDRRRRGVSSHRAKAKALSPAGRCHRCS